MSKTISAYYFPTRVLLVDDKASYLKNLQNVLESELAAYESYTDQHKVLSYLLKDYQPARFIEKIISHSEESPTHHRNIDVDIKKNYEQVYNPDRFCEISVLAIDYSMPGLTGSDICEQIKKMPIQRLMLTGEADDRLAIDLLNRKTIHQFINKSNPGFSDLVSTSIQNAQKEYFYTLTRIVIDDLIYSKEGQLNFMQDPEYLDLFYRLFSKNQGSEYYLLDDSGSFLFISFTGKPSYFVVRTEADMQAAEKLLQNSPAALQAVKHRKKLLFLRSDETQKTPINWEASVYPATKITTPSGTFYYSYITDPNAFDLDTSKILSFRKYLEEREKRRKARSPTTFIPACV